MTSHAHEHQHVIKKDIHYSIHPPALYTMQPGSNRLFPSVIDIIMPISVAVHVGLPPRLYPHLPPPPYLHLRISARLPYFI